MGIHSFIKLQIRHVVHASLGLKAPQDKGGFNTAEDDMVDVQENSTSLHLPLSLTFFKFFYFIFLREHPFPSFMF